MAIQDDQFRLRKIDPDNKSDVASVAGLHHMLLDWGPISKLGIYFLRNLVYTHLVKDGLIQALLYEIDGTPAGFVAYTTESFTFYRRAFRRHWIRVGYATLVSSIRNPTILSGILKALRMIHSRNTEDSGGKESIGEILAIGVLPEYRKPGFIQKTGLRVPDALFHRVYTELKNHGLRQLRLSIDAFNKPAMLFYHGLGGRVLPHQSTGNSTIQIWFDL